VTVAEGATPPLGAPSPGPPQELPPRRIRHLLLMDGDCRAGTGKEENISLRWVRSCEKEVCGMGLVGTGGGRASAMRPIFHPSSGRSIPSISQRNYNKRSFAE
jgi:hypothetical protein